MKKVSSILTATLMTTVALTAVPFQVSAEEMTSYTTSYNDVSTISTTISTEAIDLPASTEQSTENIVTEVDPTPEEPQPTEPAVEIPETGTIYGTMQIPYADFFKAEFEDANNSDVEVDAVSSATDGKWKQTQTGSTDEEGNWKQGGLVAGTYYEEAEKGGKILGVVYPVAIQAENYEFLRDNYNFVPNADLTAEPTAYKEVTVDGENVTFSKINDTDGEENVGGKVFLQTQTKYGDYQIQVENYPKNADTYGAIVKTTDGNYYAMRALENIWRNGQYAWSVGYVTDTHGNNIDNPDYYDTNGATIDEVVMITLDGYKVVKDVNLYLPVIFTKDSVNVENGTAGNGTVTADLSTVEFPADYQPVGKVADGFTVEIADSTATINYENALPNTYTLTISDENGKYADVKGTFTLSTDSVPVVYDGYEKLIPVQGFTEDDAKNFIKNISSVQVGEDTYKTGKKGVTIIKPDGTIDKDAKSNDKSIFEAGNTYHLVVKANAYDTPVEFDFTVPKPVSTDVTTTETTASTTTTTKATTAKASSGSSSSSGSSASSSATAAPKTGQSAGAVPFIALGAILGLVGITAKKNKK